MVMRKHFGKLIIFSLVAFFVGSAIYRIYSINHTVLKTLAEERARLNDENNIPFVRKVLPPNTTQFIKIVQSTRRTIAIADFNGSYFAATGGGLVRWSFDGKLERHFTVLDGLPESDLTCLTVFDNKLFIGTRTAGLLAFDGSNFEGYEWPDRESKAIMTLLQDSGRLLIGTFGVGLIEFDGREFTEIKVGTESAPKVNSLFRDDEKLYIGTFDDGLYVVKDGVASHFTTANGLSSNRVVGIVRKGTETYVATDLGFGILRGEVFQNIAVLPALSGMALHENRLFLTRENGEIFTFEKVLKKFEGESGIEGSRFSIDGEKLWHLSTAGISEVVTGRLKPFGERSSNDLADNFVSAIAFDKAGNLWVGTFRRGMDVFAPGGRKRTHIESEQIREINFLKSDGESMVAATSAGLVTFGSNLSPLSTLTKADGLPSKSIMHFSSDAIATTSGFAFRDGANIRILSVVQGLPNNSTYAILRVGERLYVGTLGGLAEIEGRRVVRTFNDTNSSLSTNWVTALCRADDRLFIGTYGGGIFELMPSGEIHSFEPETGKFTINFNTMYSDGERLYVGTLDGAMVLDLRTQEWKHMTNVLPSRTVMAINGDDAAVYFGTVNGIARIERRYFK